MENEIRYSQGGGTESLVFKNESPRSNWFATTFYVEQMPNGIWSIYSENPKWEKRLEYEYGFASKEDAIDIAKINADIIKENDPESYFMSREYGDGGNLDDKTLKGYRVRIFRSDISTSSANILNSENSAILVTDGKSGDSSTVLASEPHLKLIKRDIFGKTVLSAEPVNYGHESKSKMFGGSFIWSTDSRFRNDVSENPIALHDRVEYKKGGNLDSDVQSKISKLEKVVNSTMIPDSIKDKAKLEIENLKATASKPETPGIAEEKGLSADQRELNKKVLALVKKNNIESAYDFQSLVGQTLEDSNYHEIFFRFAKLVDPTIKTKENWYRSTEFDGTEVTRDVAIKISQLCGWDLNMIAPALDFVLRMSGRQNIADKLDKAIRNEEVETPATKERPKLSKKIRKGTLSEIATYVPKRSIESLSVTIDGQKYSFYNEDIIDGIYVLKTSLKTTPKVTRTQFEEEEFEFSKGGNLKLTLKESEDDLKSYLKSTPVKIDFGGYDQFDGENVIFVHYKEKDEDKVDDLLNAWVSKHSWKNTINVYQAVDNFSNKEGYWTYVIEETEQMSKGGGVDSKSITKVKYNRPGFDIRVRGAYEFQTGKDTYIFNVLGFEQANDDSDSLEISDALKQELGSIIIKNNAWNKLNKGLTIQAHSYNGNLKGKLKRISNSFVEDITKNGEKRTYDWYEGMDEMAKGGNVGDSGNITDSKSMYQGKRGIIEMDMGTEWIVKILDNGKEKSVTVRKSGFKVMDDDFAKGGYTEPSYDLPIRGKYKFVTKDGKEFILNVTRYERENDTEDSLVISQDQDKLRDELGSIIIKNSAWRNLTKLGKTVMARASKGSTGKITKINDTLAKGGMAKGWSHKKK